MSFAESAVLQSSASFNPIYDIDRIGSQHLASQAIRGEVKTTLPLRHAGHCPVRIGFEYSGDIDAPAILVAGGISAHKHVLASVQYPHAGWWQAQAGAGLNPKNACIVAIDWLAADGSLDVPIDPADQADAIHAVLNALGIERLHAFVGCSYGAMVGLHFAARYAPRLDRLIAISGTHRPHPYSSAWRALQRQIVALGALQCDAAQGLSLARQLAMLSYRTPEEFNSRFDDAATVAHGCVRVAAEDYLEACGKRYIEQTSPTAFLRLSESIDLHTIAPEDVRVPTTVVGIIEDRLVPVEDAYALVENLPRGKLKVLRSPYGHDAFLKETQAIADVLLTALAERCEVAA